MLNPDKAYSQACERNQAPLLQVLGELIPAEDRRQTHVLEIGSGTGQHAAFFARELSHVVWQPSDRPGYLDSVCAWRDEAGLDNLLAPIELDLFMNESWPSGPFDMLFATNVIHIAPWPATEALFKLASRVLAPNGRVFLYGPFRYTDRPLEPSNAAFDRHLMQTHPERGIRCYDDICIIAKAYGFEAEGDIAMPSNNRSVWWQRTTD